MKLLLMAFLAFSLFACAPSTSSSEFDGTDISFIEQVFWTATRAEFETFILEFARQFDPKFRNAYRADDLSSRGYQILDLTLNSTIYTDTDNKPYRLTIFIGAPVSTTNLVSYLLMNEENVNSLEFAAGTLANRLNAELTKAIDAKFKRR